MAFFTPNSHNILVVSASPTADLVLQSLRPSGNLQLSSADSGQQAIELLSRQVFDLLISDYELPDFDIWRLSAIVRSGRFCDKTMPIIVLQPDDVFEPPSILSDEYRYTSVPINDIQRLSTYAFQALNGSQKLRLLIIEDNPEAAAIARAALRATYDIDVEPSGERGLASWEANRHDLVLLDLKLGQLSGETVLQEILNKDSNQGVIIVTAYDQLDNHKNMLLEGASEFISKPYDLNSLRNICQVVHNKSILMREIQRQQQRFNCVLTRISAAQRTLIASDVDDALIHLSAALKVKPNHVPSDDDLAVLLSD